jgi:hypothetical protein
VPDRLRLQALRAAGTLLAVVASFCTTFALCRVAGVDTQPAIVAAVLALTLTRRPIPAGGVGLLTTPLTLTGVALAATGVGWLLFHYPPAGSVVFIAGMFLSMWLRNFGERGRTAGALIALPLIVMLIVPPIGPASGGPLLHLLLVVVAGLVAFAFAALVQRLAHLAGLQLADETLPPASEAAAPKRAAMSPQTRTALQLAVALAAAFATGFAFYPGHWGWAVLTAFIVCSGARGRGDAVYKGVLRLIGAVTGTVAAAALTHIWLPSGAPEAVAIFAFLYVGLWLRELNYAYWAACMTLVLALLGFNGSLGIGLLELRLQAILAGALCAVAATWFVFPIRTEAVIRRRLADALRAFDDLLVHGAASESERSARLAHFERRMIELDAVAPPVRWHRRIFVRRHVVEHPAHWIDLASGLRPHARAFPAELPAKGGTHSAIRRALGVSRRAIANHGKADAPPDAPGIGAALGDLYTTVATARERPCP